MTLLQYHVAVMGQWCFFDGIWPHRRRNEALLHASAEKQLTDTDCGENGVFFSWEEDECWHKIKLVYYSFSFCCVGAQLHIHFLNSAKLVPFTSMSYIRLIKKLFTWHVNYNEVVMFNIKLEDQSGPAMLSEEGKFNLSPQTYLPNHKKIKRDDYI